MVESSILVVLHLNGRLKSTIRVTFLFMVLSATDVILAILTIIYVAAPVQSTIVLNNIGNIDRKATPSAKLGSSCNLTKTWHLA